MTLATMMTMALIPGSTIADEDYSLKDRTFDNVTIRVATRNGGGSESVVDSYYLDKVNEFNEMDNGITVEMTKHFHERAITTIV